jgi:hypothetical protein
MRGLVVLGLGIFAALACRARSSRSVAMRFSSSLAGSSFGSCGTSCPVKAWRRMLCRNACALFSFEFEIAIEVLNDGELVLNGLDDRCLFGGGSKWKAERSKLSPVHVCLPDNLGNDRFDPCPSKCAV